MKKRWKLSLIAILMILLVFLACFLVIKSYSNKYAVNVIPARSDEEGQAPETKSTISIPGFETLRMRAGTEVQAVRLYNPAENDCYFLITILLPDGTQIFQSDLIPPGEEIKSIHINTLLQAGTYEETQLLYACYSLDDLQALNGASIKFTLEVTQ